MSLRQSVQTALVLAAVAATGASESAAAQSGRAQLRPNSQKYSDQGAKPATGRSGSASLEARALLAKDGSALLEATTGSLEAGTAPGQLRKVQVRILSDAGAQLSVDNYNGLAGNGYWSKSYQGLGRDTKLELQANAGGIDGNRNDVVTVTTLVKLSPDIAVSSLTVPSSAMAGSRLHIVGVIAEKNGDVGARATCILAIDGREVDQAAGIWVDAKDPVSCAFQTMITAVGRHQVQVYATGVSPTDWDTSNNTASATIDILSPELTLNDSATFSGADSSFTTTFTTTYANGVTDTKQQTGMGKRRSFIANASTQQKSFAFPVSVHSSLTTSGAAVFNGTTSIAIDTQTPTSDCGTALQPGFMVTACNNRAMSPARSELRVSAFGGRVTYIGTHSYYLGGSYYVDNSSYDVSTGISTPDYAIGSDLKLVAELTDARGMLFSAKPTIALTPRQVPLAINSCSKIIRTGVTNCTSLQGQVVLYNATLTDFSH